MGIEGDTSAAGPGSARPYAALLALVALFGVGLRALGLERGLWYDEAWVLDSVRAPTLHEMFFYRDWAQTTPPGVLLLLRGLRDVMGSTADAWRWVPLLCSVLTLGLVARVATRLLHGVFALPVLLVVALSPELIWYSTEIKQYAFDLLCTAAVMCCGCLYIAQPSRERLLAWFLLFAVLSIFSYTLVFILPAMVVVAMLLPVERSWRRRVRALWLPASLAFALCAVIYLVFGRANSALPSMYAYWHKGFLASSGYSPGFFLRRVAAEQAAFLPFLVKSPTDVAALLALGACGVAGEVRRWPGASGWALAGLLTLPLLTVLIANLLGLYPLAEFRLLYFLCGNVALLLGLGLQWLTTALVGALLPASWRTLGCSVVVLAVLVLCGFGVSTKRVATVHGLPPWESRLDMRAVVRFLHAQDVLQRPVFVHVALRQLFRESRREFPITAPVRYGEHGWPCCIPGKPWTDPEFNATDVALDTARAVRFIGGQTGYLVLRRNRAVEGVLERDLYAQAASEQGCERLARYEFPGVQVLKVRCPMP